MKRILMAAFALVFAASISGLVFAQVKEFKGDITDDMCGAKHMMENVSAKECADKCVEGGSKYALYVAADKKVYAMDKQGEAKKFSGESVVVKGTLSQDGKSIAVSSIEKPKKATY